MIRWVALALSAWAGLRWLGVVSGLWRMRRLPGEFRREGRRAVVVRASLTLVVSIFAVYAWAQAMRLQPRENFVGFLAMLVMVSLSAAAVAAMMQPQERSDETLDLFTLGRYPHGGDD